MKRRVQSLLGRGLALSGLARRALGHSAVVAVFHRIDDRYPGNPITVGAAEFGRYCALFRRHFDVVSVATLLDRLAAGRPIGGMLAITFDDGYRDNHRVGAETLDRFGLPACFFICTGFIGTTNQASWDRRDGAASEWMTWDEVRDLARRGHEIGAHTMTHPDLGVASAEETEREVRGSLQRLEREIGRPVDLFCYPFGGPDHLSESNRDVIRGTGVRCCFSCHGGVVTPGDDPMALHRAPVSPWHLTPWQYLTETVRSSRSPQSS